MATIGSLSVMLAADSSGFNVGINAAQNKLSSFASFAAGAFKSIPGIAVFSSLPFTLGAIFGKAREAMNSIADIGKASKITGFSVESMSGVMAAVGGDSDLMVRSLGHMNRFLGEGKINLKEFEKTLEVFGLDAKDLVSSNPEKAFEKIAARLVEIRDPFLRADLAQKVFGKGGQEIILMIDKLGGSLEAAKKKAAGFGLLVGAEELQKALEGKKAFKDVEKSIQGFGFQLAIGAAPGLADFAGSLAKVGSLGKGLGQILGESLGFVLNILRAGVDWFVRWKNEIIGVAAVLGILIAVMKGVQLALRAIAIAQIAVSVLAGPAGWAKVLAGMVIAGIGIAAVNKLLNDAEKGGFGNAANQLNQNTQVLSKQEQAARDLMTTWNLEIQTMGMGAASAQAFKIAQEGLTDAAKKQLLVAAEQKDRLQELLAHTAVGVNIFQKHATQVNVLQEAFAKGEISAAALNGKMNELNKALDQSKIAKFGEIFERNITPLEKFTASMREAVRVLYKLGEGEGQFNKDLLARDTFRAFMQLKGSVPTGLVPGSLTAPKALERGSVEEASFKAGLERASLGGENLQEKIKMILEASKMVEEAQLANGRDILEALKQLGPFVQVGFNN